MAANKLFGQMVHSPTINGWTVSTIRCVPYMRSCAVTWSPNHPQSFGVEQFAEEMLPVIRDNNRHVLFTLHRSYTVHIPKLFAEYEHRRLRQRVCTHLTAHQVLAIMEQLSIGADFREGRKRGVKTWIPRARQIRLEEDVGRHVYHVKSKVHQPPKLDGTYEPEIEEEL